MFGVSTPSGNTSLIIAPILNATGTATEPSINRTSEIGDKATGVDFDKEMNAEISREGLSRTG